MSVLTPAQPFEAPAPAEALVPTWPRIVATVGIEGLCQVVIDGTVHDVQPTPTDRAMASILALVRNCAQDLGRTVRMDTVGPEGLRHMLVSPQGACTTAEPDAPSTCARPSQSVDDEQWSPLESEPVSPQSALVLAV